jgi:RNA polymerase-interacting CarD/CdnL/TRCF family regulator
MTRTDTTFHIGDTVVYVMYGTGRIKDILTRATEGRPRCFYQIVLEKGEVLVPVEDAATLGLRHALLALEVPQVLQRMQHTAARPVVRGQTEDHYTWCKSLLRQGSVLGLAEVRRFLHDLEQIESFANPHLRQLRAYVYAQLPAEIAQALACPLHTAEELVDTALTSTEPVALPS